jgi:hypothetical protein
MIADREFGQSQEPASRQVVLRKAEPLSQRRRRGDGQARGTVGVDVSKDHLAVALRPSGEQSSVANDGAHCAR